MSRKEQFKEIFAERITRDNAKNMLEWLERDTDFFTAPASTKYHGAYPGGLAEHALNVYHRLREITIREEGRALDEAEEETVAILALLHDVCKVNCYRTENRRRKNPGTGYWEDCLVYVFRDPMPLGHGEKSLYLIQRHLILTPGEAMAIRWHMGAYDSAVKGGARDMGAAMELTPWVWRMQEADMCATWVDERGEANGEGGF